MSDRSIIDFPCRWCHEPLARNRTGRIVGLDGNASCNANTSGCGPTCGFFCGCNGSDTWTFGNHEPSKEAA